MRTLDLSPLFRSTVGFDRMMRLFDEAMRFEEGAASYPPYNIQKTGENAYRITMAVAGFRPDELSVTAEQNTLLISGRHQEEGEARYLHRGIAARAFERRFELADFIKVTGASLSDGLLHVELAREVPEEMKPRTIRISSGKPELRQLESQADQAA